MFPGAKIIAIDDEIDALHAVVQSLRSLGLASISYNYPDEAPSPGDVAPGIRIVFLDINLVGGASPDQDANVFNAPISLLDRLISDGNGPYALITWSSTHLHDRLVERIKQTAALAQKQPFYARALDKAQYATNPAALKSEIEKILSENPAFGALLDWEARVARASNSVLRDMHDFAGRFDGDAAAQKMDRMLSKLAVDAFGQSHVEDHRFESVNEALLPLLHDALNSEFFSASPSTLWDAAVTQHKTAAQLSDDVLAQLNGSVLFERSSAIRPYRRGAVLKVPDTWMDPTTFEQRFGLTPKRIRGEQLKLDSPKELVWVLVQAQAACDFANSRVGPIPYLLAAVVPADAEAKKRNGVPIARPDSVWPSPLMAAAPGICDKNFRFDILHGVVVSMTRSAVEQGSFAVLGRLKDQVLSSIAHEHHSHGGRPGYISFR